MLTVLSCAELYYRDLSGQMLPPVQTWRSPQLATTACSTAGSARLTRWPAPALHSASASRHARGVSCRVNTTLPSWLQLKQL